MPQRVASAGQGLVAGIAAASALILVAAAPTPTLKPQPSPTVNWNKFHLDLGNTAFNDQEKTLTKGTVKHLNLLWQFTTNGAIYESPSVSGSRVFVGDSSGTLWVLNNDTGAVLDQLALGNNAYGSGAYSTPTVEGDFIYYQDASGNLVKYDLVNRVPVWTALAPPQDAGFCSPVVYNGRVYAGLSNGTLDNPCTVGKMQAFDEMTGALLWNWDAVPPGYLGGGIWQTPAIDAVRNLVLFSTGNPPNGNPGCGDPIPPDTPGDHTDSIVALDATTGSEVWTYQAIPGDAADLDFGGSGPTLFTAGGRDLVATGSKDGRLYCLDRSNGQVVWIRDLIGVCNFGCGGIFSPPGNAHGRLFLNVGINPGSTSASIAVDGATGNTVWQHAGSDPQFGGPGIANGMVFIGTSHDLRVYDEATGAQLASWTTGGVISSSPAIANGRIYFGSTDHTFYVLKGGPPLAR